MSSSSSRSGDRPDLINHDAPLCWRPSIGPWYGAHAPSGVHAGGAATLPIGMEMPASPPVLDGCVLRDRKMSVAVLPATRTPTGCRYAARDGESSGRSEEHTSELQSRQYLVCRLLLEKKKKQHQGQHSPHAAKHKEYHHLRLFIR